MSLWNEITNNEQHNVYLTHQMKTPRTNTATSPYLIPTDCQQNTDNEIIQIPLSMPSQNKITISPKQYHLKQWQQCLTTSSLLIKKPLTQ